MHGLLPIGLALAFAMAAPAPTPPATASEIEALLSEGKLDEAVSRGREAVGANPSDPDLRLLLARALAARARRLERIPPPGAKAEDVTVGPLKVPHYGGVEPSWLRVVYEADAFEEAILHLDEGIRRAPARKDLRLAKIYLLTDASRISRAAAAIREAIRSLRGSEGLARELASFGAERARRGDDEAAATLLGVVASAFPSDAEVQADYGFTLARLGRKAEAYEAFDRAARVSPKDVRLLRMRANVALVYRDFALAMASFEAAFTASREDADRMGAAAAAYGIDPASSEPLFRELATEAASAVPGAADLASRFLAAIRSGPASAETLGLARELVSRSMELLAIPLLSRAVEADPSLAEPRAELARVYRALRYDRLAAAIESPRGAPAPPSRRN